MPAPADDRAAVAEPALRRYLDLLLAANRTVNLTAVRDAEEAWRRHVLDSLTLLRHLADVPAGATLVDVGSGGGLPGVPLALARPDLRVTLVEATGKKARVLAALAGDLGRPDIAVCAARAEELGHDPRYREQYDVATCRAVGSLAELLEYTLPLVRVGGRVLAMKGAAVHPELAGAERALRVLGGGTPRVTAAGAGDRQAVIVEVVKERPTPDGYPRAAGRARKSPL